MWNMYTMHHELLIIHFKFEVEFSDAYCFEVTLLLHHMKVEWQHTKKAGEKIHIEIA